MDLMTLAAKLTLDDSGYRSGIKDAESAGERLAGKMSAMTVAAGNIMSDLVKQGFNTVKDLVGGAIDSFADYQQLIGGVETLFKTSSTKVEQFAKESFRTTGLSANEYMETVTSFSASLLQGLQGDTDAAAELANTAIMDMADNANKMGTDISSIQTAYQGFAKQNYTMLDNLKLGYGGTKEEMLRLVNESGVLNKQVKSLDEVTFDQIIEAIHKIQEEMGITGTTAKEASETISGSKDSMVAAWNDLMAAVGGSDLTSFDDAVKKFQESFSTYMDNLMPTLLTTIVNSGDLVDALAETITNLPTELLGKIVNAGLTAGTGIMQGVTKVVHWLIDSMANMFRGFSIDATTVAQFGEAVGYFIGSTASKIIVNIPAILEGLVNAGITLSGSLISGLLSGLFGEDSELKQIKDKLSSELSTIEFQTTEASAILDYMDKLVQKYGEAAANTSEWKDAQDKLKGILGGSDEVFKQYEGNISGAVERLREMNEELKKTAITNALQNALSTQIALEATQELEYTKAENKYKLSQSIQESITGELVGQIMKEAAQKRSEMDENGGPESIGQRDYYNKLTSLSEGFSHIGDRMTELADLDFSGLVDALNFLDSEAYSTDELEGKRQAYADAATAVSEAEQEMKERKKELEATQASVEETKIAVNQMIEKIWSSGNEAAESVEGAGNLIYAAGATAAGKISSISFKPVYNNGRYTPDITFMPRAVGLDFVPYDGFRAELHRGEAIITRDENSRRNGAGGLSDDVLAAIDETENRLTQALNNVYFNVDGQKVASLTTAGVHKGISANEHARVRAMGG